MTAPPDDIWTALPVAALIIGEDGTVEEMNPAAENFFHTASRAMKGSPIRNLSHVDARLEAALERVRSGHAPFFIDDFHIVAGDRPPRRCDVRAAPLNDRSDRLLLMLETREIADRMGRARRNVAAAKSAVGMAEMLAHEIKNPLAGISGAAQLLSMGLSAKDRELTDLIVAETRRIVALLEQVEMFGDVRPPDRRAVNLHEVLERSRKSALVGFASHMRIGEEYDPSLPSAHADADQLQQVFLNILKNAAEANPNGGSITIRTFYDPSIRVRAPDGSGIAVPLNVEITDDGPGPPPDIAADMFEPFVSGRENGTGLGLALVSKIIGDHNGWLSLEGEPGRTRVRVALPRASESGDMQ